MRATTVRRVVGVLALTVVVAALAYATVFRLHGGRWERVETPSMGTTAPVGSLLWVEPTDAATLRVGDFITFHPPGEPGVTYSHRVHRIHPDGTITTKGEISNVDPWRLHPGDVVGRVHHVWRGAGWAVRAAPILLAGGVLTWGVVLLSRRRAVLPLVIVGAGLTLAAAVIVLKPLTAAEQLSFVPTPAGAGRATYVATGLLPVRVEGSGGDAVVLGPGQVGSVTAVSTPASPRVSVAVTPHVPRWFWWALVGGAFLPALGSLATRTPPPVARRHVAST